MTTHSKECPQTSRDTAFTELFPEIEQRLRYVFRHWNPEARDDATAEGIVHCFLSYRRLHERGRVDSIKAASLVWYAAKQVRDGRRACCRLNSEEPLSRYAQLRRGIRVERLDRETSRGGSWIDALTHDSRATVLDLVAARLDVADWLATLRRRPRRIAVDLAQGCTTAEVARKNGVTNARISQLRQELKSSWGEFQHEPSPAN